MGDLRGVVEGYVTTMRPKGEAFCESLTVLAAPVVLDDVAALISTVHKFAGSAGSAGFMRLSAVASLIEIALRAVKETEVLEDAALAQILCLKDDFAAEIAELTPSRSALLSGQAAEVYVPFSRPLRVLVAGMPEPVARILVHVIEQSLGIAWILPDVAMLAGVPPGREPDFAVVMSPVADVSFPVVVFHPCGFDDMAMDWPTN
ncbi:MAG: Hpt domain-containing protein [Rhodospirillaceae bacterium]|nr:Hpt domain-containing protein [Rhodospirillaceae bacterium]